MGKGGNPQAEDDERRQAEAGADDDFFVLLYPIPHGGGLGGGGRDCFAFAFDDEDEAGDERQQTEDKKPTEPTRSGTRIVTHDEHNARPEREQRGSNSGEEKRAGLDPRPRSGGFGGNFGLGLRRGLDDYRLHDDGFFRDRLAVLLQLRLESGAEFIEVHRAIGRQSQPQLHITRASRGRGATRLMSGFGHG